MTKGLLTLAAALSLGMAASAAPAGMQVNPAKSKIPASASLQSKTLRTGKVSDLKTPISRNAIRKAPMREAGQLSMAWGYGDYPSNALQLGELEVEQCIYFTPELATKFAGNKVTALLTGNPADASDIDYDNWTFANPVKSATMYISEELGGARVRETSADFVGVGFDWSTFDLAEDYVIEAGKGFYVGVSYTLPEDNPYAYGWVCDYWGPENFENSNIIYTRFLGYQINEAGDGYEIVQSEEPEWRDYSWDLGNAAIRLNIVGDNLPENEAYITDKYVPNFVAPGDQLMVELAVTNYAANAIENVEIELTYAGEEPQKLTGDIMIGWDENDEPIYSGINYNETGYVMVFFNAPATEGYADYTVALTGINGAANNAETSISGSVLCLADGFHKTQVIEEGTGTWCGYCVYGYAGMEYIRDNYSTNDVIGIALHNGDEMEVLNEGLCYEFAYNNFTGFPCSFLNRNWAEEVYPDPETLVEAVEGAADVPALCEINAILQPSGNDRVVTLFTDAQFVLPAEKGTYGFAYTVVEDNVGPYLQSNYMTDCGYDAYGFENLPNPCLLKYNDVARNCSHPEPFEGSIPEVKIGRTYSYATVLHLDDVTNLDNYRVIAMVVNQKTGAIENATEVKSPTYGGLTGINAVSVASRFAQGVNGGIIISGETSGVKVYGLDGKMVAAANGNRVNVPAGVYFVRRGNELSKVVVR